METWAGSRGHPPRLWGEAGAFGPLPASQPQSSVFLLNSLDVTLHILSTKPLSRLPKNCEVSRTS